LRNFLSEGTDIGMDDLERGVEIHDVASNGFRYRYAYQ
jgi:hypothetical protein